MLFTLFFFNDTATTEIYTLSLHDALPIWRHGAQRAAVPAQGARLHRDPAGRLAHRQGAAQGRRQDPGARRDRKSTRSELQSRQYLVCRLLLEKKKKILKHMHYNIHSDTAT